MITGFWLNAKDASSVDFSKIKGRITDIFISEAVTDDELQEFIRKAHNVDIKVHLWVFCFNKSGKWVNPADQAIRDEIKNRIKKRLDTDIDGIHLDYVRYQGTAYKYNGTEHITSFCKEVKEIIGGKTLSAAVMPETDANAYYYGQDYEQLSKYLIPVPMVYKGNYKADSSWIMKTTARIKDLSKGGKVWTGLQAYYSDSNPKPLPYSELKKDIDNAIGGGCDGIVFFRWGLLTKEYFEKQPVDFPTQKTYIQLAQFKDMIRRYKAYVQKNKREPRIIYLTCCQGEYVKLETFKDMLQRYKKYTEANGREPLIIYLQAPKTPGTTPTGNWTVTGFYIQDYQDTNYTCGPSSLQMALSALGCNVTESQLKTWAGTTTSGTGHQGLVYAIKKASERCGRNITGTFYSFKATGWSKVEEWIKEGKEIVIHLWTSPLKEDIYHNIVWKGGYGHYVYLVGVNNKEGLVKIADPMKGIRTFRKKDVEAAMSMINQPSILLLEIK